MLCGWRNHYKKKLFLTDMSASTFFAVASCNFLTYASPVTKSIGLEDLHTWEKFGLPNQRGKEEKKQNSNHCLQCVLVSGPSIYHVLQRNEVLTVYSCTMCFVCTIPIKLGLMDISWLHHLWWFQKDIGLCPYQNSRKFGHKSQQYLEIHIWYQLPTWDCSKDHRGIVRNKSSLSITWKHNESRFECLIIMSILWGVVQPVYIVPGI